MDLNANRELIAELAKAREDEISKTDAARDRYLKSLSLLNDLLQDQTISRDDPSFGQALVLHVEVANNLIERMHEQAFIVLAQNRLLQAVAETTVMDAEAQRAQGDAGA